MPRTDDEILQRIHQLEGEAHDFFGFQRGDLIQFLPFEAAKPFLKEGVESTAWTPDPRDEASIKNAMHEYMEFAWGKANNCRGLSAGRSINHMQSWLWMLGFDASVTDALADYDRYGKPQLRAICEHFGWDWRQWDDGEWMNDESGPNLGVPEEVEPLRAAA